MPAKGTTKTPEHKIEAAVKKYLSGEPVSTLAKEHSISRAGFYLWVAKYKDQLARDAMRSNMTAGGIDKSAKIDLAVENNALKAENAKLKHRLFELMVETDRL